MPQISFQSLKTPAKFHETHKDFFNNSSIISQLIDKIFNRKMSFTQKAEMVVFLLGEMCVRNFREIGLLAENGYGWGATSHLRGMFERVVTMKYVHQNPTEAISFIKYGYVQNWKAAKVLKNSIGLPPELDEKLVEMENEYKSVDKEFLIDDCKTCQTKRVNYTWNKLDLISMAKKVGGLENVIYPAYYLPITQNHATFSSLEKQLSQSNDGKLFYDTEKEYTAGETSITYAHLLLLHVFNIQIEHFQLNDLGPLIQKAYEHHLASWLPEKLDKQPNVLKS